MLRIDVLWLWGTWSVHKTKMFKGHTLLRGAESFEHINYKVLACLSQKILITFNTKSFEHVNYKVLACIKGFSIFKLEDPSMSKPEDPSMSKLEGQKHVSLLWDDFRVYSEQNHDHTVSVLIKKHKRLESL